MFAVTGSFYSWGIKGSYSSDVHEIVLNEPLSADTAALTMLAVSELKNLNITAPEGKPKLKKYGSHYLLEWTGSSKDLILEPTENVLVAKLTIKNTSWYRNLVQLHKAKGGTAFKVYAVIFAIALGLLLISGFIMAWITPNLRTAGIVAAFIGLVSFIVFISFS